MTMYAVPDSGPDATTSSSRTFTAPACSTRFAAYPSRRNRSRTSLWRDRSGCRTLTAARAPLRCVAAYTAAMPPTPRRRSSVHLSSSTHPTRSCASRSASSVNRGRLYRNAGRLRRSVTGTTASVVSGCAVGATGRSGAVSRLPRTPVPLETDPVVQDDASHIEKPRPPELRGDRGGRRPSRGRSGRDRSG